MMPSSSFIIIREITARHATIVKLTVTCGAWLPCVTTCPQGGSDCKAVRYGVVSSHGNKVAQDPDRVVHRLNQGVLERV